MLLTLSGLRLAWGLLRPSSAIWRWPMSFCRSASEPSSLYTRETMLSTAGNMNGGATAAAAFDGAWVALARWSTLLANAGPLPTPSLPHPPFLPIPPLLARPPLLPRPRGGRGATSSSRCPPSAPSPPPPSVSTLTPSSSLSSPPSSLLPSAPVVLPDWPPMDFLREHLDRG